MPVLKNYRLFISHAWDYGGDYQRLVNLLSEAKRFRSIDYSVPQHDPIMARSTRQLRVALRNHIRPVHAVLIISGMYVNYRDWIQYEIDVAQDYRKPIIGIEPRGSQRVPAEVRSAATTMVKWNTNSIVKAIRKYAI